MSPRSTRAALAAIGAVCVASCAPAAREGDVLQAPVAAVLHPAPSSVARRDAAPFKDTDLAMVVEPSPPGAGRPPNLERATLLLLAKYYDLGYLDVVVDKPLVHRSGSTFLVHPGARYRVTRVHVVDLEAQPGDPLGEPASLAALVHVSPGDWFPRAVLVANLDAIRTRYRDEGYASVEVEPQTELDRARREVSIEVPIHRGPLTTLDRVDVLLSGAAGFTEADVRARLLVHAGDRFHETRLTQSKAAITASLPVEAVDVSTEEVVGHPDRIVVTFEVTGR